MSDESPRDNAPANDAPTDETAALGPDTAAGEAASSVPPPPPGEQPGRQGFYVPKWAAVVAAAVVAVLVLFGGGFALGHVTAGGGDNGGGERFELEIPRRDGDGERPDAPRLTRGVFLGVATRDATGDVQGAEIINVASGSPAAQAGLRDGDVVTAVDGSAVANASDLVRQVRSHESGDQMTITYSRDGNSAEAQVTLGTRASAVTAIA